MSRNTNYRAWGSVGHYLQGPGLLEEIESYTSGFGTKHFYIIDVFFFDTWTQKLAEIYENSKSTFQRAVFEGEVTRSKIREFQEQAEGSPLMWRK